MPDAAKTEPDFDGPFDEERAKRLIAHLRDEVKDTKAERDALKARVTATEDSKKTDDEKGAERLNAALKEAADAKRALFVERAVRKHELPDDVVEFLSGDTEEEIFAKAERLSTLSKPKAPEAPEAPAPEAPERPTPDLKPGHNTDDAKPFDAAAIAAASRR